MDTETYLLLLSLSFILFIISRVFSGMLSRPCISRDIRFSMLTIFSKVLRFVILPSTQLECTSATLSPRALSIRSCQQQKDAQCEYAACDHRDPFKELKSLAKWLEKNIESILCSPGPRCLVRHGAEPSASACCLSSFHCWFFGLSHLSVALAPASPFHCRQENDWHWVDVEKRRQWRNEYCMWKLRE